MAQSTLTSNLPGAARDAMESAKDSVSEFASRVSETASDFTETATDALHKGRINTANALNSAAKGIHAGTDKVSRAGHGAADKVAGSAQYVRSHGAKEIVGDIEGLVKRHPGKSLLVAVALGFFAGRALRSE